VELSISIATAALSCKLKFAAALPAVAVSVTLSAVVTAAMPALKVALAVSAGTVTLAGTLTLALLLPRLTARPPLPAGAVSVTVHASVPAPVIDPLLHEIPLNTPGVTAVPVSVRVVIVGDVLLRSVTVALFAPVRFASNPNVSVAVPPGGRVSGKLAPETLKADGPLNVSELIVSGTELEEVRVTLCVAAAVLTGTLPKLTALALSVKPAATAVPLSAIVVVEGEASVLRVIEPDFAPAVLASKPSDSVAASPGFSVKGKLAPETLNAEGPFSVSELMVRGTDPEDVTVTVCSGAAVDRGTSPKLTVSVVTVSPAATAVPLSAIFVVGIAAFVVSVSVPVFAPARPASKPNVSVAVSPGLRVNGKLAPDTLKAVGPASAVALMVSGAVPVDVSVTVCNGAGVFSGTTPNSTQVALTVNAGPDPLWP
jgi:hypothetical protein